MVHNLCTALIIYCARRDKQWRFRKRHLILLRCFERNASYKNIRKSTPFISNGFTDTQYQFDGDNSFRKTIWEIDIKIEEKSQRQMYGKRFFFTIEWMHNFNHIISDHFIGESYLYDYNMDIDLLYIMRKNYFMNVLQLMNAKLLFSFPSVWHVIRKWIFF